MPDASTVRRQASRHAAAPDAPGDLSDRARELERIASVIRVAQGGRGSVLVVIGDPGVGKTSLLDEAAHQARGVEILRARGLEAEASLPFAGIHQLLGPLLGNLDTLPPTQRDALGKALGMTTGRPPEPFTVCLAALALLGEAGHRRPALCLVDDIQWLDAASRDVVLFVARRISAEPVSMLIASSAEAWSRVGDHDLPTLPIEGLGLDACHRLLDSRTGHAIPRDVARRLHDATGGNPLALTELVRLLSADQLAGRAPLPVPLPVTTSVHDTFVSRIAELPPITRSLLLVVAADSSGDLRTVLRAAEQLGADRDSLQIAVASPLLHVAGDEVRFRHPLIRSAVYALATVEDRRRVHAVLAVLEADRDVDRRAWHLASAGSDPDPEVTSALMGAAERAASRGAYAEAASGYATAADFATSGEERARLLFQAAHASWVGGRPAGAKGLLERARNAWPGGLPEREIEALSGVIELATGDSRRAYRMLVKAANEYRSTDPSRAVELLALASEAASLALDYKGEIELGRLVAGWETGDDPKRVVLREALVGFATQYTGDIEAGIAHLRGAVALAEDLEEPSTLLTAGRAAQVAGNDELSYRFHLAVIEQSRDQGALSHVPLAGARLALAEIIAGNISGGTATANDALRLAIESGQNDLAPHPMLWLALVHAMRGERDGMEAKLLNARQNAGSRSRELVDDGSRWIRAVLALGEGRSRDALALLDPITHPVVQTFAALDRFEAAGTLGDARAMEWLGAWARFARSSGAACALARLEHGRALLAGDPEEAEEHLLTALTYHAGSRRPFERARTNLALGSHLRRHRQRARARDHLRAALTGFDELGAVPWADRARDELRATGESSRRGDPWPIERLTPQELRIARAVAEGRSNREAADLLVLSPRTVDFHLRNVFAKLGLSSRTELARLDLDEVAGAS